MSERIISIPRGTRTEHSVEFAKYLRFHHVANVVVLEAKSCAEMGDVEGTRRLLLDAGRYLAGATLLMADKIKRARKEDDPHIGDYYTINHASLEQRGKETRALLETARRNAA